MICVRCCSVRDGERAHRDLRSVADCRCLLLMCACVHVRAMRVWCVTLLIASADLHTDSHSVTSICRGVQHVASAVHYHRICTSTSAIRKTSRSSDGFAFELFCIFSRNGFAT